MSKMDLHWAKVEVAVEMARGIAFDTCHKIYVLMDDVQMAQMKEYGYDPLISADDITPNEMLSTLMEWYEDSCALKFISAVRTVAGDPNDGFTTLIPQCAESEEEEEEEEEESMRKVVAHKGCEHRGDEPRGVYLYAKIYTSAHPFLTSDGQVEFEAGADWEAPAYGYEILCFDCDESVMKFTDEVELYKLNYAFRNYPDDYNVEIIEVSD